MIGAGTFAANHGDCMSIPSPDDERFWTGIRAQYAPDPGFTNLENGFFGMPAIPVAEAHMRYQALVNREAALFTREKYPREYEKSVAALAAMAGTDPAELAITRNTTESMNILLQGYPFAAGDELVYSNHEYESIIETIDMLHARGRFRAVKIVLPLRLDSDDDIVARYERAITPKTRVIVLTHLLHRTGRILPVARIAAMARARGIDTIVDAAHSFAHVDFRVPDLGADFFAANLHKWLGAPLGVGMVYVRRERIAEMSPLFGCTTTYGRNDIRKLLRIGTVPPANVMAIRDAIAFHDAIGGARKEARIRWLQRYWTDRVRGDRRLAHVELLVPEAAETACGIASCRVRGMSGPEVVTHLFERHRIYTAAPKVGDDTMLRVVPFLYTSGEDLDRLLDALAEFG
jgi:selenocysteine lyase/cysteine desulfurase